MPQCDPRVEAEADRRRRYCGLRARGLGGQGSEPRGDRVKAGGGNLRSRYPEGKCRGRVALDHALRRALA